MEERMEWMKRALRGEEMLWKVFWIYGIVFGLVLAGLRFAVISFSPMASMPLLGVQLVYLVWISISIWRCAFNVDWHGWGYIARILVVLGILGAIAGLWMEHVGSSHANLQPATMAGRSNGTGAAKHTPMDSPAPAEDEEDMSPAQAAMVLGGGGHKNSVGTGPSGDTPENKPAGNTGSAVAVAKPYEPLVVTPSSVAPPAANAQRIKAQCEQTMSDYATQHATDPQQYIQQNQSYLQQCIGFYMQLNPAPKAPPVVHKPLPLN